eukprot:SAG31_NODE_17887_length_654_cov_2.400000_2_plen_41_part_01
MGDSPPLGWTKKQTFWSEFRDGENSAQETISYVWGARSVGA